MMKKYLIVFLVLSCSNSLLNAQTTLQADGPGNTYELINSVLAPNYNVVEAPDCNHSSFGRHIDEVFDAELNKYVFRFFIHTSPDNDRCINFDRQRNEIKTYDKSPDDLLAFRHDVVEYKWQFKLDSAFQPSSSFTHIHQLKAVGGTEASMPLITLTPRKSSPNKLQLRYASSTSQSTIYETALAPFLGVWIDAKETVLFDEVGLGQYELLLTKVAGGDTLFHYTNNSIRTWKTNATFLRPKWGIYRSLNDSTSLRDEEVLFADFSIHKITNTVSISNQFSDDDILIFPNPATNQLMFSDDIIAQFDAVHIYSTNGQLLLSQRLQSNTLSIAHLKSGLYFVEFSHSNSGKKSKSIKVVVK